SPKYLAQDLPAPLPARYNGKLAPFIAVLIRRPDQDDPRSSDQTPSQGRSVPRTIPFPVIVAPALKHSDDRQASVAPATATRFSPVCPAPAGGSVCARACSLTAPAYPTTRS